MLESIYYVITWACNRACAHCYDTRFRPYPSAERLAMLAQQARQMPTIIDHFPDRLTFRDLSDQRADGSFPEQPGRVILAGGEVLSSDVREALLYPALDVLHDKYGPTARAVVQTAGDLLDERVLEELLVRRVWMVSISSLDAFHHGRDRDGVKRLRDRLTRVFEAAGMKPSADANGSHDSLEGAPVVYEFFGATPDAWIGKLWPSGRAWENGLSTATYTDNFCNAWSGASGFLSLSAKGSEIAVDPDGKVYPCCRKTAVPYGDLTREPLVNILESLIGEPPFEALTCGAPERMGISFGVSPEEFRKRCIARTPKGDVLANPCIGCDRIHREFIAGMLERICRDRAEKNGHGKQ